MAASSSNKAWLNRRGKSDVALFPVPALVRYREQITAWHQRITYQTASASVINSMRCAQASANLIEKQQRHQRQRRGMVINGSGGHGRKSASTNAKNVAFRCRAHR